MQYNPETKQLEGEVEIPEKELFSKNLINFIVWGDSELNPEKENEPRKS